MRLGIVGAGGYWGPNWVRVLKQLNVLGAICEKDPRRLAPVVQQYGLMDSDVKILSSYQELLAQPLDGVFIVTPPATHSALATAAMEAGKDVFIEKPLAENQEQCYQIKFESERLDRLVMVGHTFVYHPAVRKFKQSLAHIGALRTIYTVRANFGLYQDTGVVRDLLPHDLSIFSYLCEREASDVFSDVNPHQDLAFVTARYGDVSCSSFLSWSYPDKTRKIAAVGDRGILEWDLSWSHLELHKKWTEKSGESRYKHFDQGTQTIEVDDQSEPLMNEALHFMHCIETRSRPFTGVEDGISVVKGLEAACASQHSPRILQPTFGSSVESDTAARVA